MADQQGERLVLERLDQIQESLKEVRAAVSRIHSHTSQALPRVSSAVEDLKIRVEKIGEDLKAAREALEQALVDVAEILDDARAILERRIESLQRAQERLLEAVSEVKRLLDEAQSRLLAEAESLEKGVRGLRDGLAQLEAQVRSGEERLARAIDGLGERLDEHAGSAKRLLSETLGGVERLDGATRDAAKTGITMIMMRILDEVRERLPDGVHVSMAELGGMPVVASESDDEIRLLVVSDREDPGLEESARRLAGLLEEYTGKRVRLLLAGTGRCYRPLWLVDAAGWLLGTGEE